MILVFTPIDRMVRVSLRTVALEVPPQDVITRDNVSVKVSAVLYYRVIDPRRAIVEVENYQYATLQLAQTTLRSVLGQASLDDLLAERDRLNQQLQQLIHMRAKELLTDEEFREQKVLVADRKVAQEAGLSESALNLRHVRDQLRQITLPLMNLTDTWTQLNPALRQRFKRMLLPVGFVAGQIRTANLGRIFYICGQFTEPRSTVVAPAGEFLNQIIEEIRAFAELFRDNDMDKIAA